MSSSLEGTLALAIKHYRVIVDSRRFIPAASVAEFKGVFDEVFGGLLDSLPEAIHLNSGDADTLVSVDAKNLSIATDILKILIILKHFINQPVYADELLHNLFHLVAKKELKILSSTSEFDDHKATRRFETFLVNIYVLLCDDSSLTADAKSFLTNLPSARLHTTLLDAAPRASQEEMYRQSYRKLLLNISDVDSEVINGIIKRLDANYPEGHIIEGVTRKEFLLNQLGWKNSKVYNCADRIHKRFDDSLKNGSKDEAFTLFGHFWILLDECKFVAIDECCSTLFIFPSECESFLKYVNILSQCFNQLSNPTASQANKLNKINAEISAFVRKLVKAVSTNYIHFERDLNNRNYQSSNLVLSKIVLSLVDLSQKIHDGIKLKIKADKLEAPAQSVKLVADFVQESKSSDNDSSASKVNSADLTDKSLNYPVEGHTAISISDRTPRQAMDSVGTNLESERDKNVPLWAIIIAIFCTIISLILYESHFSNRSNKN